MTDGHKLILHLNDWWYSSFGYEETEESKAIKKVIDEVEKYVEHTADRKDEPMVCKMREPTEEEKQAILNCVKIKPTAYNLSPAEDEPHRLSNREWKDFLSQQFDISKTSAREMLHGMMRWKKEDNFKRTFNPIKDEPQTDYTPDCPFCKRYGTEGCLGSDCRHYKTYKSEPQTEGESDEDILHMQ